MDIRPPSPPFDRISAELKVRLAEDAWNTRNPEQVIRVYTQDCQWRNRDCFPQGHQEIYAFLVEKWSRECDYRLIKELWTFDEDKIAVRFAYEWHNQDGQWFRSYGNENWLFNQQGLMTRRFASINDVAISEGERLFLWPTGRRPDHHPGLSELGL